MEKFFQNDIQVESISLVWYYNGKADNAIHKNRHDHGIALKLDGGKTEYIFDGKKKITLGQNEMIFLPKGSCYIVDMQKNEGSGNGISAYYAINFDISLTDTFEPFVLKPKNTTRIQECYHTAYQAWLRKKPGYLLQCKAELYRILYLMQTEYVTEYFSKDKLELILPAVEYIHEHYTDELLNISELSGMCGVSPEYFRKIFKSFYGASPVKYINQLKINRAKELLLSGSYSVSEAAEYAGYPDMSYFSREFKKATGISPSHYRENG